MKALFSSTKKIDFSPIDENEYILLGNFKDISEGRIEMIKESEKGEKDLYSIQVKAPAEIAVNDVLIDKTIMMAFPTKPLTTQVESHSIIKTKGDVEFKCVVDGNSNIIVKMVAGEDETILYSMLSDGTIKVNMQLIKLYLAFDLTVSEVNVDSPYYQCFTI